MSFTKPQARRLTERLSPREREILRLMAQGLATKQIADILHQKAGVGSQKSQETISEGTVRVYRMRIFSKLGVQSIGSAVRVATLSGL